MAEVNEELVKEAIKKAADKKQEKKAGTAADGAEYADRTDEACEATAKDEKAELHESTGEDTDEAGESATENEGVSEAEGEESEPTKKKSLFTKKDKKDKRDEQIAELNDRLLRNLAEFENFRKRSEKEKSQMFEIGAKSIVEKILPTIDNFERGLASVPEAEKESPFAQGMEKIYKQLMTSLEEAGVKPIEAVGKEFDTNLHNAVMHEDNPELGENVVSEELQKGYMYHDTVIRHSMVKVAN